MVIAKFVIATTISFGIPIRLNPCRAQLLSFFNKEHWQNRVFSRAIITFLLIYSSAAIAYVFPDIYASYTLVTGTMSILISIIFPGLLGVKLKDQTRFRKMTIWVIIVLFLGIGITAAIITLLTLVGVL